jgi:hypothetical protein
MFLDFLEEELFKWKERVIEISIEKDNLLDSVSDLEKQLILYRKKLRKLEKQFEKLKLIHSKCH